MGIFPSSGFIVKLLLALILFLCFCLQAQGWVNPGFESGNLNGWTVTSGTGPNPTCQPYALAVGPGPAPHSQGTICVAPAVCLDQVRSGSFSAQLDSCRGDDDHLDWIRMEQTDIVPSNGQCCLSFWFAAILSGHHFLDGEDYGSDAYVLAEVLVGGAVVGSLRYSWYDNLNQLVDDGADPFGPPEPVSTNSPMQWRHLPWTPFTLNLCAYAGQQATIRFTVHDCDAGGHNAFGYLDDVSWTACPAANLSLTKSNDPPGAVAQGATITYTLSYANNGTQTVSGVRVTDSFPPGTVLVPGSIGSDPLIPAVTVVGNEITWAVGTLAPGASGTLTFQVAAVTPCLTLINVAREVDLLNPAGILSNAVTNRVDGCSPTPSRTATSSATRTPSRTVTPTSTRSWTSTSSATATTTPSRTATATSSRTSTLSSTATASRTASPSATSTLTITRTATATLSATASATTTSTASSSATRTSSSTSTRTATSTVTSTFTGTAVSTSTRTSSSTSTVTFTRTASSTATGTSTASPTRTSTRTATSTVTSTFTGTAVSTSTRTSSSTSTVIFTRTASSTATGTSTASLTRTSTRTVTPTVTPTSTGTALPTLTRTASSTSTVTFTRTASFTATGTSTASSTRTATSTTTFSATSTAVFTGTASSTGTATSTRTETSSATATFTRTSTFTPSWTSTTTSSRTFTPTRTASSTATDTSTRSWTPTASLTSTRTATRTFTFSPTATDTFTVTPTPTATSTPTFTPTPTPGLSLAKRPSRASARRGDLVTYHLDLTVTGSAASNVQVTDLLPPEVSFIGFLPTVPPIPGEFHGASGASLVWSFPLLSPGTYRLSYETRVADDLTMGTTLVNHAGASFPGGPSIPVTAWVAVPAPFGIEIGLYNGAGERVRTLYSGSSFERVDSFDLSTTQVTSLNGAVTVLLEGRVVAVWDGRGEAGNPVANGAYFLKLDNLDPAGTVTSVTRTVSVDRVLARIEVAVFNGAGERIKVLQDGSLTPVGLADLTLDLSTSVIEPGSAGGPVPGIVLVQVGLSTGGFSTVWDGMSEEGTAVTNGLYFVQVHGSGLGEDRTLTGQVTVLNSLRASGSGRVTAQPGTLTAGRTLATLTLASPPGKTLLGKLYNLAGELVREAQGASGAGQVDLETRGLSSGLYLAVVEIRGAKGLEERQVVRLRVLR